MEKINLTYKIKSSVLIKNIQLETLEELPQPLKANLSETLKKAIIFYKENTLKGNLKILNEKEILFLNPSIPINPTEGDLFLIIIPYKDYSIRYVFQLLVEKVTQDGIKLKILSPKVDNRLILKTYVPSFISYISQNLFFKFLQKNYFLLRQSNFSLENISQLNDLQFYDLIFNGKNQIDEEFKKEVSTYQIQGELRDISSGGMCIKISTALSIPENIHLTYTKFEVAVKKKTIKCGLLCHLKHHRLEGQHTFLHLSFLISFKPEIWDKIKEILSPLVE